MLHKCTGHHNNPVSLDKKYILNIHENKVQFCLRNPDIFYGKENKNLIHLQIAAASLSPRLKKSHFQRIKAWLNHHAVQLLSLYLFNSLLRSRFLFLSWFWCVFWCVFSPQLVQTFVMNMENKWNKQKHMRVKYCCSKSRSKGISLYLVEAARSQLTV